MVKRAHSLRREDVIVKPRNKSKLLAEKLPGNHFTFREKTGMISFMPRGREQKFNADGTWKREGRQSMKPARWLRAMLNPRLARRIGDDALGAFATIIKHEELRQMVSFELVPVKDAYNSRKFTAITSCMWNQPIKDFYEAFGCQALVAVGGQSALNKWRGRAIVWSEVEVTVEGKKKKTGITFMDRVYADSEEVSVAMREYAGSQGWFRKLKQNRETDESIMAPDGEGVRAALVVTTETDLSKIRYYPYLDTLAYGRDNFTLSNSKALGAKYTYQQANEGSGTRTGDHDGEVRDRFLNWIPREDAVQDYEGRYIRQDEAVEIEGYWYHEDSCLENSVIVRCEATEDLILARSAYRIEHPDGTYYIHSRFVRRGA